MQNNRLRLLHKGQKQELIIHKKNGMHKIKLCLNILKKWRMLVSMQMNWQQSLN